MAFDIKSLLGNPVLLATLGGWGGRWVGKKYNIPEYLAIGGGAVVGYLISKYLAPTAPVTTPMALQPPAQQGYGALPPKTVNMMFGPPQLPSHPGSNGQGQRATDEVDEALAGEGDGGVFGKSSFDTTDVQALTAEAEQQLRQRRH